MCSKIFKLQCAILSRNYPICYRKKNQCLEYEIWSTNTLYTSQYIVRKSNELQIDTTLQGLCASLSRRCCWDFFCYLVWHVEKMVCFIFIIWCFGGLFCVLFKLTWGGLLCRWRHVLYQCYNATFEASYFLAVRGCAGLMCFFRLV